MAEFKFACLHCGQKIQVEELWSGHELQCPSCHKNLTVPPNPAAAPAPRVPSSGAYAAPVAHGVAPAAVAAAPPPPGFAGRNPPQAAATRLSSTATKAPASAPPSRAPAPAAPQRRPKPAGKAGASKGILRIAAIAGVVIVLGVGGYFGYGLVSSWQEKASKSDSKGGSGQSQVGHIGALYGVLDATDPDKRGGRVRLPPGDAPGPGAMNKAAVLAGQAGQPSAAQSNLPVLPAVWTLDVEAGKIPEGRANGMLSGTNFLVDTARIDTSGAAQVLSLRQGTGPFADREMLIYLHLNPGENLASHKWTISKDMKGSAAPQVIKRWKADPRYAPKTQTFPGGYAMKLELGAMGNGSIPGKIFLALPDTDQSVVAGMFDAVIGVPVAAAPAAVAPQPAPMRKVPNAAGSSVPDRYGIGH